MPTGVYIRTKETRNKISEAQKGHHLSEGARKKLSEARRGHRHSEETRKKMSKAREGKSYLSKGGITSTNQALRSRLEYRLWRKACFRRDHFTCQICGRHGGDLIVHHVNNFAEFYEIRCAIDNGIVLCKECHKQFHKIYGIKHNTKEQLEEFFNIILKLRGA